MISGLVALHTRLLPIWSILGRKLRMLTVAFPSLEALKNHKKHLLINIYCIITFFVNPENCIFFSILAKFGPIFGLFLPIWSILGRKLRMLTVAFPSLEAFFTRSKLNESAFYYILTILGYLVCLCCTAVHS